MLYLARYNGLTRISKARQILVLQLKHFRKFTKTSVAATHRQNSQHRLLASVRCQNYARRYMHCPQGSFLDCFMTDDGTDDDYQKPDEKHLLRNKTEDEKEIAIQIQSFQPFKLYNMMDGPKNEVWLSRKEARLYYQQMVTIRRMEVAFEALFKDKLSHLYRGQEAYAVGIKAAMRDSDKIITSHRCHGWCYIMNTPLFNILAELAGRGSGGGGGVGRAKDGSLQIYSTNCFGAGGIFEAQFPLGAGVALSSKYKGDGGVCFALYDAGVAGERQLLEAFSMAALWQLPIVFVYENNNLGCNITCPSHSTSNTNFYKRGEVVPGIWVDSSNVLAIRSVAKFAIDYVLRHGPVVLKLTNPVHLKRMKSVFRYNPEKKLNVPEQRDSIKFFKDICQKHGLLDERDIEFVDKNIRKEFDDVVRKSKTDLGIELKELLADNS